MSDLNALWGEIRSIHASRYANSNKLDCVIRLLEDNNVDLQQFIDALPALKEMFQEVRWDVLIDSSIYDLAFIDKVHCINLKVCTPDANDQINGFFERLNKIPNKKPLTLIVDTSLYTFNKSVALHKHLDMFETVKIKSYGMTTDLGSSLEEQADRAFKLLGTAKNIKKICLNYYDISIERLIADHVFFKSSTYFPNLKEIELSSDSWNMWKCYSPQERANMLQTLHRQFVGLYHYDYYTAKDDQISFIGGFQH